VKPKLVSQFEMVNEWLSYAFFFYTGMEKVFEEIHKKKVKHKNNDTIRWN